MRFGRFALTLAASTLLFVRGSIADAASDAGEHALQTGDVVFQTSLSPASLAIQRATHSRYSHVGIAWVHDGRADVIEAIDPVQVTPLAAWIARGAGGHYVAKRLRDPSLLTPERAVALVRAARGEVGKRYDLGFEWSDARMYCSELVWKAYHRAVGVDLGAPRPLRSFDLADPVVQEAMRRRWGARGPLDEPVIGPGQIFEDDHLVTVEEH
jgi:uncharacterized protein YycO